MAKASPPLLQIGQSGELAGQAYTVAGRIEMAMEDQGVTYRWTEFHLVAPDGGWATLVQEEGERGVEWRLFRLIQPATAMSAVEAATRRVGQAVNLTGEPLRVTVVGESRVVQIEGRAAEGIEEGDIARYFNAESGNQMVVVSWTGEEVDVYRGIQLPTHAVYRAFGLTPPPVQLAPAPAARNVGFGARKVLIAVVLALAGIGVVNGRRFGCDRDPSPRTSGAPKPPPVRLLIGTSGLHDGTRYQVVGREQLDVSRVGSREARQEYWLLAEGGGVVLLEQESESQGGRWHWLTPVALEPAWQPAQAATNRLGDALIAGGETVRVTEMFLSTVVGVEGTNRAAAGLIRYGLGARGGRQRVELRWDENVLSAYRITSATPDELASFGVR